MSHALSGAAWAFCWGMLASAGLIAGALLGLATHFGHRAIAAVMSLGAGVLLSLASAEIASEALELIAPVIVLAGVLAGGAAFSIANAALASVKDRKRCGECVPQPTEANAPGTGTSIAVGTALDAFPEALILGVSLRAGGPHLVLIIALALSNLPEALSGTSGMRLARRSVAYVLSLWSVIALGTAVTTALAFLLLGNVGASVTALLKAFGAGALIAMAAETMIPEGFHNGPRYSGVLAAAGFGVLVLVGKLVH